MKQIYLRALLPAAILCLSANVSAHKAWVDVTAQYINNPSFDNGSSSGWTFTSNASGINLRCGAMEFWQGTFHIHQTVQALPAGDYRLSVSSYHRCKDNPTGYPEYLAGQEDITAYLYAGTTRQQVTSVYAFPQTENIEGQCWTPDERSYFPNTMESATATFRLGCYLNTLPFSHAGGDLTIGLINEHYQNNNWCIFDDFKLEAYQDIIQVTALDLHAASAELVVGEQRQLTPVFTPADATLKALRWESDNENVARVDADGHVTAIGEGEATITATTTDGSDITASLRISVTHNSATASSLVINEVMAGNIDQFISPAFNFDAWIELYNPSDKAAELGGLYISDTHADLRMYQLPASFGVLPAHGYRLLWFDSHSLNPQNIDLKLDTDGGMLFISDANAQLIASITYPAAKDRVSYARTTDGGTMWGETSDPTPGSANQAATYCSTQLDAPLVSHDSQLFTGTLHISVPIPNGTTLRYTTDGSLPTMANGNTSSDGLFAVTKTTGYRFRLFQPGRYMASPVTTRSYILKDKDYRLPIISVVSDDRFLYDDSIGVMVRGVNGRPGNGQSTPCNWNMDWERPVNFSFITPNGQQALNQDVYLEMVGGWSRAFLPHSVKLKGNKRLGGNKNLPYPFFSAKPYIRNRTLQIRNGGNDNDCRIKDAAVETIIQTSNIDIDLQSYQPVHEFLNGRYIGVLNMREPNNKHYVYANYGLDDDEIEAFEMNPDSGYVQTVGDGAVFDRLYNLSADAARGDTYDEIKDILDINEYINYMAMEFYCGSTDWPQNNIKGFCKSENGKYRFVSYDLDFVGNTSDPFNLFMKKQVHEFSFLYDKQTRITAEIKMVTLFRNLLDNEQFRKQFIDTYCLMGGSVFEPRRCTQIIDSLTNIVGPEMALNGESPYSSANSLKNIFNGRNAPLINALQSFAPMQLSAISQQQAVLGSNVREARLEVNGLNVPTGNFSGTLFAPVRLRAIPPAGHIFAGWKDRQANRQVIIGKGSTWLYYDKGSLDGSGWTASDYNAAGWSSGAAPLGYTMSGVNTVINYGGNNQHKYPTYYFRHSFTLDEQPDGQTAYNLEFSVDDGFVVYINGREAGRYNMPSGNISYNTYSTTYAGSTPLSGQLSIDASLMRMGTNVVCIEVHNSSAASSDLYWDGQLTRLVETETTDYYATDEEINMPEGDFNLMACYEPMETPANAGFTPVRINEISAANDRYINEYGKKNDWVELYNTTSSPVNIEGMYLSNDPQQPEMQQLSKGQTAATTIIPAHGYLVIWCDKLATKDYLHTNFKLGADGGVVMLTAADKSWTDSIRYPGHDAFSTVGRYTDGGNGIYAFNMPTIGQQNIRSSYATLVEEQYPSGIDRIKPADASGLVLRYAAGQLIVRGKTDWAEITIYTLSGQQATSLHIRLHDGMGQATVAGPPGGCYVARATDRQGHTAACKFVR